MDIEQIYRSIARQNGVSLEELKEEMQKAINEAWDNPDKSNENIFMQSRVNPDGRKPTPDELLRFIAKLSKS